MGFRYGHLHTCAAVAAPLRVRTLRRAGAALALPGPAALYLARAARSPVIINNTYTTRMYLDGLQCGTSHAHVPARAARHIRQLELDAARLLTVSGRRARAHAHLLLYL